MPGGSPGADFLGTTTIGLAQGLMLFLMTPAHSKVSNLLLNPRIVFEGEVIQFLTHWWGYRLYQYP